MRVTTNRPGVVACLTHCAIYTIARKKSEFRNFRNSLFCLDDPVPVTHDRLTRPVFPFTIDIHFG